jgi:hypothetical protein
MQSNEALVFDFAIWLAASEVASEWAALPPTDQSPQLAEPPIEKELLEEVVCSAV